MHIKKLFSLFVLMVFLQALPLHAQWNPLNSILPLGPTMEWSTQKPKDPIEVRVPRGADGDFTLHEDENDNCNYEKRVYATIPFHWNEAKLMLTIGARQGNLPGMLQSRTFQIVFVGENDGVGVERSDKPDKVVQYSGSEITIKP